MLMSRALCGVLLVAALGSISMVSGCQGRAAEGGFYTIEVPKVAVAPGAEGRARIRFVARAGYHWNEEFPARLEVLEAQGIELAKTRFSSGSGDFLVEDGMGILEIPLKAAGEGSSSRVIRAQADFSVCNDKECRIFKGIRLEVPVDVR